MVELNRYDVTVRTFDPSTADGEPSIVYVLPVDSTDVEHAVSAAVSNVVAFTAKTDGTGSTTPVAFAAVEIHERPWRQETPSPRRPT